jgi:hypothetical protein
MNETDLHPENPPKNQIIDEISINVIQMEVCLMINMNL